MAYLPPIKKRGITHTIVAMYNTHHCGEVNLSPKLRLCPKVLLDCQIREQEAWAGWTVRGARGDRALTGAGRYPTGWRKEAIGVRSPVGGG